MPLPTIVATWNLVFSPPSATPFCHPNPRSSGVPLGLAHFCSPSRTLGDLSDATDVGFSLGIERAATGFSIDGLCRKAGCPASCPGCLCPRKWPLQRFKKLGESPCLLSMLLFCWVMTAEGGTCRRTVAPSSTTPNKPLDSCVCRTRRMPLSGP